MTSGGAPPVTNSATNSESTRRGYGLLLGGVGTWFGFWAGQMVIFQWVLVEALDASAAQVGGAQTALALPSLLFLLLGGATADRFDPTRLILSIHLATGVVGLSLALAISAGMLTYPVLIGYAISVGTLQAFAFPARDTLLSEVVRGSMSRAVVGTTVTQHGSQVVGALVAGAASVVGAGTMLAVSSLLVASGAIPLSRLPRRNPGKKREPPSFAELRAGVLEVARSSVLAPVMVLAIATGVFFVGPYLVILPLMVRDVYGGGASEMALLNAMFPLGSVTGGLVIFWRGGIRRCGRALALGQISAALCIGVVAWDLPFAGTMLGIFGWGLAGSLFINAGRTIFQTHASAANRARVLSVYTFGVMGGLPLGSTISGLAAAPLGLHASLGIYATISLAIAAIVLATTPLWRIR